MQEFAEFVNKTGVAIAFFVIMMFGFIYILRRCFNEKNGIVTQMSRAHISLVNRTGEAARDAGDAVKSIDITFTKLDSTITRLTQQHDNLMTHHDSRIVRTLRRFARALSHSIEGLPDDKRARIAEEIQEIFEILEESN